MPSRRARILPTSVVLALTRRDTPEAGRSGEPHGAPTGIEQCLGFAVEAGGRPLGIVSELRSSPGSELRDVLAVRAHGPGRGTLLVPVGDVLEVRPAERRVILRTR